MILFSLTCAQDSRRAAEVRSRIDSVNRIIEQFAKDRDEHVAHARQSAEMYRQRSVSSTAGRSVLNRPVGEDNAQEHLPHLTTGLYQDWDEWTNRYVLHNPEIQLTNATREILLKYYYSFRDRRGFVYHMSAAAVSMIREVAKKHEAAFRKLMKRRQSAAEARPWSKRRRSTKEGPQQGDETEHVDTEARTRGMHDLFSGMFDFAGRKVVIADPLRTLHKQISIIHKTSKKARKDSPATFACSSSRSSRSRAISTTSRHWS